MVPNQHPKKSDFGVAYNSKVFMLDECEGTLARGGNSWDILLGSLENKIIW